MALIPLVYVGNTNDLFKTGHTYLSDGQWVNAEDGDFWLIPNMECFKPNPKTDEQPDFVEVYSEVLLADDEYANIYSDVDSL